MAALVDVEVARAAVVQALADVEGLEVAEVDDVIARAGGEAEVRLDSKQAEVIIASAEELFGYELPSPADLPKDRYSTVAALVELVAPAIQSRSKG